ncbi:unnamed protein product [Adineta steineri]|uniref:Peptidylprolyl isomerase n=1 Tax=Adineta steineri TaxID=433720 RepID=A0A815F3R6_9BILA|nr:unnamed protein product [Adineta steineri]CAF1265891.1 unnamed protein product [Adineta steineri]CAF1320681.1 unnamed protein product [Adineta steineri]
MGDMFSFDYPNEKRTFISKLNPDSPVFYPSSFYHHIQEVTQPEFSFKDNNNHSHIQPITNGYHEHENYYSTTIHSIEPSQHHISQTSYIQEMIPNNRQSTTLSHIEPVNITHDDLSEQSLSHIKEDNEKDEKTYQLSTQLAANFNDENLDKVTVKDDIPPTEISIDRSSTQHESHASSNESQLNKTDAHPITELQSLDDSTNQDEPDDVLGNNSLLKHTLIPGIPDTRPSRDTLATVSYKLFLFDNLTKESRLIESVTNENCFVGEYDILPAIDIVIQLMDRGERAMIDSEARHCYGDIGCEEKQVPPITSTSSYSMKIDLELHDWKYAPEIQALSVKERLYWSDKKRQRGNFSYRRKEYSPALTCYRNALKFIDIIQHPLLEDEEENTQSSVFIDRYIQVQNNLAQVHLLNNQYQQCLEAVNDVLKHDPNNIKALFRQAKALFELGNYDEVIQALKLLLQNPSKDVEKDKVNEMLNICETKLAKYQKNEKEIYKRMFKSETIINDKSQTKNNNEKIEIKTNNAWHKYFVVGGATVLAAIGLAALLKYK